MPRRRVRRSVARLARRGDLDRLGKVLEERDLVKDRDGRMLDLAAPRRVEALEALAAIDDDRAGDLLVAGLGDPEPRVRLAAVEALGRSGREQDAELVAALVRWQADIQTEERRAALALLRDQERPELAVALADGLLQAGQGRAVTLADQEAIAALKPAGAPGVEALCGRLIDRLGDDGVRAQRLLESLGEPAAEPLIGALEGPHRVAAVTALGTMRSARAVEALTGLVADTDSDTRAAAARALGEIRDPQAAEALLHLSLDTSPEVRDAAQEALERLGVAGLLAGFAAFVAPLVGRIERLEAARPEPARQEAAQLPPSVPARAEQHRPWPTSRLRRALGR